ncbi:MAG: hypothetical protein QOI46_3167 [Alphaproteobacteria bacterium]|nr:hypothetical protein [Alphaproteobacteria bacterium]
MRYELADYEWAALKPMLPNKPRGVPRVNDRRVLNGIFWVLRSGAPWRDLPETFGPYTTCYNRFVRWRRAGVWSRIMNALAAAHDTAVQMIDTSIVRVHQHGACITRNQRQSMGRSRGGLTSKIHALVDSNGLPVRLAVSPGEARDNRLAALEAWGADSNLFHQGAAKESHDPDVIAATMAKPGVVLKRPVGSSGPFKEHADLPGDIAGDGGAKKTDRKVGSGRPQKHAKKTVDEAAGRKASLAFEKERERRERERAKEEAAQRKERERRQEAVDRAQAALDTARRKHDGNAADIQAKLEALEERSRTEEARWEKERSKLEALLRRARG